MSIDRVVIATDLDTTSEQALRRAAELAEMHPCEVTLAHVRYRPAEALADPFDDQNLRAKRDAVEAAVRSELVELTQRFSDTRTAVTVPSSGDPVDAICTVADDRDADLLIVGSEQRSWLGRLLSPSIAEDVAHRAPCPVMVVGEDADADLSGHWLVHDDGTMRGEKAIAQAAELARAFGANVTLYHAFRPQSAPPPALGAESLAKSRYASLARERLQRLAQQYFSDLEHVHTELVCMSSPARGLPRRACAEDVDVAVVSATDRGRVASIFADDADQLIRDGRCAALVVPDDALAN